jgi:ankyrin repeat protein
MSSKRKRELGVKGPLTKKQKTALNEFDAKVASDRKQLQDGFVQEQIIMASETSDRDEWLELVEGNEHLIVSECIVNSVAYNRRWLCEWLLDFGIDVNTRRGFGAKPTLLLLAARIGRGDWFKFLIGRGADVHATGLTTGSYSLLSLAVQYCDTKYIPILLEHGVDINEVNQGNHVMVGAILRNRLDSCKFLVDHGLKLDGYKVSGERTYLSYASRHAGTSRVIEWLIQSGLDVNSLDSDGDTPLLQSCLDNTPDTCRTLLEHKADPDIPNANGITPLIIAARHGHAETCRVLCEYKADPNKHIRNRGAALYFAASSGHVDVCKALIECKADILATGEIGGDRRYPIKRAAARGRHLVVRLLLDSNCSPSLVDDIGDAAIDIEKTRYSEQGELLYARLKTQRLINKHTTPDIACIIAEYANITTPYDK